MTQQSHYRAYTLRKSEFKKTHVSHVHCSIIYNSQDMEATYVSTEEWMDKENVVYIYNGILFSHKKEGNPAIHNNMDGTWGHYAKWNKSAGERQILHDITYMWNIKNLKTKNQKTKPNS